MKSFEIEIRFFNGFPRNELLKTFEGVIKNRGYDDISLTYYLGKIVTGIYISENEEVNNKNILRLVDLAVMFRDIIYWYVNRNGQTCDWSIQADIYNGFMTVDKVELWTSRNDKKRRK